MKLVCYIFHRFVKQVQTYEHFFHQEDTEAMEERVLTRNFNLSIQYVPFPLQILIQ